ncbi:MAG: hypothetical protein JNJ61_11235, partial [Anaerolineae bacterium]|nr:hypothetical protein [Anaerolineae bacterium]
MIAPVLPTKQALLLVVVLLVAVLMRVGYVDVVGHSDIAYFQNRAASIAQHGLFSIYSQDEGRDFNYPPLYFYALAALNLVAAPQADAADGIDPAFMRAHKWVQIGVDLALIVVAYVWSGHRVTQRRKTQDFTTEAQSSTEEYRGWFFLGQGEFFRSGAVSLLIPLLIAVYP